MVQQAAVIHLPDYAVEAPPSTKPEELERAEDTIVKIEATIKGFEADGRLLQLNLLEWSDSFEDVQEELKSRLEQVKHQANEAATKLQEQKRAFQNLCNQVWVNPSQLEAQQVLLEEERIRLESALQEKVALDKKTPESTFRFGVVVVSNPQKAIIQGSMNSLRSQLVSCSQKLENIPGLINQRDALQQQLQRIEEAHAQILKQKEEAQRLFYEHGRKGTTLLSQMDEIDKTIERKQLLLEKMKRLLLEIKKAHGITDEEPEIELIEVPKGIVQLGQEAYNLCARAVEQDDSLAAFDAARKTAVQALEQLRVMLSEQKPYQDISQLEEAELELREIIDEVDRKRAAFTIFQPQFAEQSSRTESQSIWFSEALRECGAVFTDDDLKIVAFERFYAQGEVHLRIE